jgi:hypothetical protein
MVWIYINFPAQKTVSLLILFSVFVQYVIAIVLHFSSDIFRWDASFSSTCPKFCLSILQFRRYVWDRDRRRVLEVFRR